MPDYKEIATKKSKRFERFQIAHRFGFRTIIDENMMKKFDHAMQSQSALN